MKIVNILNLFENFEKILTSIILFSLFMPFLNHDQNDNIHHEFF